MDGRTRKLAGISLVLSFAAACGRPPATPVAAKDVMDFSMLFGENCEGCHGVDGKNGAAPVLNSGLYLAFVPKEVLRQTIEKGVPGTPMPAFAQSEGGPLDPAQVGALVSGMEEKWAKPAELNTVKLPPYKAPDGAADVAHGKQVFTAACARCHADQALKQDQAGSITNASFLSLVSDQGLRTSTIVSRPDFGIADWRGYTPGHTLTDQEITDVVAYLGSLRPIAGNGGAEAQR